MFQGKEKDKYTMQILELLFLINGLKKCKWTSLCTWYVIFALFTHIFYISKTDKILPFFSQFSSKFLQHFWGNRFTCMMIVYLYSSIRSFVIEGTVKNGENWYMTINNQFTVHRGAEDWVGTRPLTTNHYS